MHYINEAWGMLMQSFCFRGDSGGNLDSSRSSDDMDSISNMHWQTEKKLKLEFSEFFWILPLQSTFEFQRIFDKRQWRYNLENLYIILQQHIWSMQNFNQQYYPLNIKYT